MNATRLTLGAIASLSILVTACSGGDQQGSGGSGGQAATGPTYYRDVKPIIDVKCSGCHVDGGIAPFPLTTFDQVSAQKSAIVSAISSGLMPPWPPNAGCSDYVGDRSLAPEHIDTISKWVNGGAPAGSPNDKPVTIPDTRLNLSRVDLTVKMPEAYTPTKSPDDYRCFLVDLPSTDTFYVTGVGVKPDNAAIVHHVIAFLATPENIAQYQQLDDAEPGPGYTCFGGPGGDLSSAGNAWLGAWAPGSVGSDFPEGTGIEVPAGSKLIIQVHYNTSTAMPAPDQSSVLFKTDKTVAKKAIMIPWTNPDWLGTQKMDIPPHTMDAMHSFIFDPTPYMSYIAAGVIADNTPFTLYSASLHMHTRGTRAVTNIARKDGSNECMLDIEHWNFHWQGGYGFTSPKTFNPGDQLSLECHWNNMDANDVYWGEGTGDEMCLGVFYATQ